MSSLGLFLEHREHPIIVLPALLFDEVKVTLPNGKLLLIRSPGASQGKKYIRSIKFNGNDHKNLYFDHRNILWGGEIRFDLQDSPQQRLGGSANSLPPPHNKTCNVQKLNTCYQYGGGLACETKHCSWGDF